MRKINHKEGWGMKRSYWCLSEPGDACMNCSSNCPNSETFGSETFGQEEPDEMSEG